MFDTMKFDVPVKLTEAQIKSVCWTDIETKASRKLVRCKLIDEKDDTLPRIYYSYKEDLSAAWLKVELSAPRYLYGSNVYELMQVDIKPLFRKLRRFVSSELGIPLSQVPHVRYWEMEKLHLCKNFDTGSYTQDYLNYISKVQKSGGYKTIPYYAKSSRLLESVFFEKGKSQSKSVHKFYDKWAEVHQKKGYPNKGILTTPLEYYALKLSFPIMK